MGTREAWPRRMRILRFLALREARGEGSPSVREVAEAVGYKSKQPAHKHLTKLEELGYLERAGTSSWARTSRLTERGWRAVGEVPLLGRIAAGRGMEAVPVREGQELAGLLLGANGGGRFLLEARGQSMTGAGIEDGDLLLVAEDPSPPDGTVVAAMLGGGEEVTVKRLFREGETVRLKAENGGHTDIVAPAEEVEVQGRVELILRKPWR